MKTYQRSAGIRAFTLIEIMVALVIVGVLATIAIPSYRNFIEDGKSRMCRTNLVALKSAFDIYMVEHNVVPGDLGQIPSEDIEKAFASALRGAGWQEKFARFIESRKENAYAFAALIEDLAKGNLKALVCPSDPNQNYKASPSNHNSPVISYAINPDFLGMTKADYVLKDASSPLIADTSVADIPKSIKYSSYYSGRHKRSKGLGTESYANIMTLGGFIISSPPNKCESSCSSNHACSPSTGTDFFRCDALKECLNGCR